MPVAAHAVPGPVHLGSHTSPVSVGFGVLIALFLLVLPGAIVARVGLLTWPTAVAVGPALTYGVVALSIVPFGALGVPWNAWTALFALAVVTGIALGLRVALRRVRDVGAEARAATRGPALVVAAGVLVGGLLIDHSMRNPHVPPGVWRGVNGNQNAIYLECFMDELAHSAGQDPLCAV